MARKFESLTTGYEDMMRALDASKFVRTLPVFAMHVEKNGGLLPDRLEAHACWYYCTLAHKHLARVEEGGIYVGDQDTPNSLFAIAKGVAAFYKLDSPSEFLKHIGDCALEAIRCGMDWNKEIEEPLKSLFKNDSPKRIIG
jgi:hypothetical protein